MVTRVPSVARLARMWDCWGVPTVAMLEPALAGHLGGSPLASAVLTEGFLDPGPWSSQALLLRIGLPLLLVAIGVGLWVWGRRERAEARAQIGVRAGFGGPPGSSDIGSELGFGVHGRSPDPHAGRARMVGGLVAASAGVVILVIVLIYRLSN